ncbi:MAG: DNA-binding MarR family transcriptional regulator [Kiritimatiellia bacterium]|jgi:DNA-binding MarR family transcriptional regulator
MIVQDPRQVRAALRRLLITNCSLAAVLRPSGTPMSMPYVNALLTLGATSEPLSIADLARTLQIDRTNVSRLCARMEEVGELTRMVNPADRRSRLVRLTERGRELAQHVDACSAEQFEQVLLALNERGSEVVEALTQLADAMESASSKVIAE